MTLRWRRIWGGGDAEAGVWGCPTDDCLIEQCHERGALWGEWYLIWRWLLFSMVLAQHEQLTLPPDFVWSNYYFSDDVLMVGPIWGADSLVVILIDIALSVARFDWPTPWPLATVFDGRL